MEDGVLVSDGGAQYRDPNAERDADHYGPGAGGKKRKTPAFVQYGGRQEESSTSNVSDGDDPTLNSSVRYPPMHRPPRSRAATACAFRKALFLRRKAALITLYIDAQNVISNGYVKPGMYGAPKIMDIPAFEDLMPSLEDIGTGDWPPDQPDWRSKWEGQPLPKARTLEQWRAGFEQRHRRQRDYKPTARGGWAPEGSFEFEVTSQASKAVRAKAKDRAALHKLIVDLRSLALSAKPQPNSISKSLDKPPQKAQRTAINRKSDVQSQKMSPPLSRTVSKESDPPSLKGKSKKKKKKRSVMANQGNPHHVDNYRPSRKANLSIDPFEPYPHHESLLFPPPMRLLSTVPQRRTAPLPGQITPAGQFRAPEDEFICCFCEMDLFFGTEAARKRAIRRLKEERRRKESIRNKAKDVAEGKGKLREDESEYDDDEDWCGEDDGHGRCTCGRQISEPHRSVKSRLKPPETDPPLEALGDAAYHADVLSQPYEGEAPIEGALSHDQSHVHQANSVPDFNGGAFVHEDLD